MRFEKYLPDYRIWDELKDHYRQRRTGRREGEEVLKQLLQEELAPDPCQKKKYEANIHYVYQILKEGSKGGTRGGGYAGRREKGHEDQLF